MRPTAQPILILGATGQQGSTTARHLLAHGWRVRAFVRDPHKPLAQILQQQGAELFQGDLNDAAALSEAMQGVYGVFSVLTFFGEHGVEGEIRQGQAVAEAAKVARITHLVYSSVAGAERHSGIPHFESKWQIEQHIRSLALPATILRPVYFFDNLHYPWGRPQVLDGTLTVSLPLPPERRLQMIAVEDVAALAARAFEQPQAFIGKELEIAGDELTMSQVAEILGRAADLPARFIEQPIEQVRSWNEELATMFEWFNTHGFQADIPAIRQLYPSLMTFEAWLRAVKWQPQAQAEIII